MLNFNHLYYFHVAATEGSVAAAAGKLGLQQSTVSEQLRALERTLGSPLFERTTTGLRLTVAGQTAFEYTSTMFSAGERLLLALGTRGVEPLALRAGTSSAIARATPTDFLLPLFDLDACFPSVITGETLELIRLLRASELDLVLCETELPEAALQSLQHDVIEHIPLVAIAATSTDHGPDWQDIGLIQYRPTSSFHWEVNSFLDARNLRPRTIGFCDDPYLLVELAARPDHVAVVPRSVARDPLANGRVRILAQLQSSTSVHAYYSDGSNAAIARRAIERLVAATHPPAPDSP